MRRAVRRWWGAWGAGASGEVGEGGVRRDKWAGRRANLGVARSAFLTRQIQCEISPIGDPQVRYPFST